MACSMEIWTYYIGMSQLSPLTCCEMLKVGKRYVLRFLTVINACDCNSSYYKREGSSLITTSELGGVE